MDPIIFGRAFISTSEEMLSSEYLVSPQTEGDVIRSFNFFPLIDDLSSKDLSSEELANNTQWVVVTSE